MILVTGSTGKVGQGVVQELKAAGKPFRVGARSPEKVRDAAAVAFDFDRPETFGPALRGVERLFLLTSGGTAREAPVVDAAARAGVAHVVKLSVWDAEKEGFELGRQHRAAEKKIEASGLSWTFLRPNSFMQNFVSSYGETIRSHGAFYPYGHGAKISVIDTRDVAAVAFRALTEDRHGGKAYRLSGPEGLTNAEAAEKLSRVLGKPIRSVDLPDEDWGKALVAAGIPQGYADLLVDLSRYIAAGHNAAVTQDFEAVTGRKPISLDQYFRDYASVWK
jgi:uncharacterized protein YbjT (DUF2867 family)